MADLKLTEEELKALDLLIATLKAHPELQAMFIGDIVRVVVKVADVVAKVAPVVVAATKLIGATSAAEGSQLFGAPGLPTGSSLEQLVELRKRLGQ